MEASHALVWDTVAQPIITWRWGRGAQGTLKGYRQRGFFTSPLLLPLVLADTFLAVTHVLRIYLIHSLGFYHEEQLYFLPYSSFSSSTQHTSVCATSMPVLELQNLALSLQGVSVSKRKDQWPSLPQAFRRELKRFTVWPASTQDNLLKVATTVLYRMKSGPNSQVKGW